MADNRIGLEVDIPVGKAEEGVKSLRGQIAALKKEIGTLEESDPKFDKLVKEAAALEDKMGDINQRVKALASDTSKLEGFTAAVSGIAGGFAAAQGAMGLFAEENEDLNKSLLKVQSAMALLNGVQEVANQLNKDSAAMIFLQAQAMKVYSAAVGTSTGALKGFRIALIATGIGALVAVLGLVVANWDKITAAITKSTGSLKRVGEIFNEVKKIASGVFDAIIAYFKTIMAIMEDLWTLDFKGAAENAKNLGKNVANAYSEGFEQEAAKQAKERADAIIKATIGDQNRLIARMEAAGEDVYDVRKKLLSNELSLLEKGTEEYADKLNEIEVLRISKEKEIADERKKIAEEQQKKAEERQKREAERLKQENEKRIEEEKRKQEQIQSIIDKTRIEIELDRLGAQERELRELEMKYEEELAIVAGNLEAEKLLQENYLNNVASIIGKYYDDEIKRQEEQQKILDEKDKADKQKKLDEEKAYADAKRDLAVNSAQGILSALSEINTAFAGNSEKAARKAFGIQKALSIAETVIGTYSAAQNAFANTLANPAWKLSPDGGLTAASIAAGVAIAGGLARVAAISKQQFQSSASASPASGGGGAAGSPPSGQTPSLNPDVPRQRLNVDEGGGQNMKVFVVESDITSVQDRVRRIDRRATVGEGPE